MTPDKRRRSTIKSNTQSANKRYDSESKQHVDIFRKNLLRKALLKHALPGSAYIPFCGDGDIAKDLYTSWNIYGADLDQARIDQAQVAIPSGTFRCIDCNVFPFSDLDAQFSVGDFDAYSDPYTSFRSFWTTAEKAPRMALFFTENRRGSIIRFGYYAHPNGEVIKDIGSINEQRKLYNSYYRKIILPWFEDFIKPYKLVRQRFYLRSMNMLYWGAVVEL